MKNIYLTFAIVGAVVPYLFFFGFFAEVGLDLPAFVGALFANGAAGGFSADLLLTSCVFWLVMFQRRGQGREDAPAPWLYIGLNLTIGLSCAFPAYLYTLARRAESGRVNG